MGIGAAPQVLLAKLDLPSAFKVCEFGSQEFRGLGTAEDYYRKLGAGAYTSIDINGQATVTADLNRPLSLGLFDLVTDWGTSEHIFDQGQVWRTRHDLTRTGGVMALELPFQGHPDHGFYSIHPGLIRAIAKSNNYLILVLETPEAPTGLRVLAALQKSASGPWRNPTQERRE